MAGEIAPPAVRIATYGVHAGASLVGVCSDQLAVAQQGVPAAMLLKQFFFQRLERLDIPAHILFADAHATVLSSSGLGMAWAHSLARIADAVTTLRTGTTSAAPPVTPTTPPPAPRTAPPRTPSRDRRRRAAPPSETASPPRAGNRLSPLKSAARSVACRLDLDAVASAPSRFSITMSTLYLVLVAVVMEGRRLVHPMRLLPELVVHEGLQQRPEIGGVREEPSPADPGAPAHIRPVSTACIFGVLTRAGGLRRACQAGTRSTRKSCSSRARYLPAVTRFRPSLPPRSARLTSRPESTAVRRSSPVIESTSPIPGRSVRSRWMSAFTYCRYQARRPSRSLARFKGFRKSSRSQSAAPGDPGSAPHGPPALRRGAARSGTSASGPRSRIPDRVPSRTASILPTSAPDTLGRSSALADPVSRNRPGLRSSSTDCLMASKVSGTRCTSSSAIRFRGRVADEADGIPPGPPPPARCRRR